jgi:DNA polymerase-3 subunit delta
MKIGYQEFLSRTQKGLISPVYVFSGKDVPLKEGAVGKLKKIILKPGTSELNFSLFYGEESTGSDIARAASAPTLTGDNRLIVVKNADKLKAPEKTIIKNYTHSPLASTCLVLLVTKNDYKFGDEVVFAAPSEREAITWITRQVRERGCSISTQAASELKEKVGVDTQVLQNEIEKLALYCWDKKNIITEDIRALVSDSKEADIFGIANAINKGNVKKALAILKKLSGGERKAPGVINTIAWQMRQLAIAKTKIEHGEEVAAVCREMRIPFFIQQDFISCVEALEWNRFKKNFRSILQAEFDFKSGGFLPVELLELLIMGLSQNNPDFLESQD